QLPDDFPSITTIKSGETAPGYIFLTVSADVEGVGYYVFMMDDDGNPVLHKKLEDDYSYDFKVQPNGLLSYAQFLSHHSYTGGGNCIHMVLDEEMNVVDSFQLKNGYIAEAHDFQLLPNGHVLAFGYYLTQMDLSDIVDGGYPNAMVSGGIVQELDNDKNVVWQWRSWDHYDHTDYSFGRRSSQQTVSEFHLTTINLDTDGHMFLGTPSWTKKINRQTGEIMWHLGGDENEFSFIGVDSLEAVSDLTGHAFYRLENGNVLIYDNGPRRGSGTSEAHEYMLDEVNKITTKVRTFTPETDIAAWHRGNAQRLPNENTLVGWGGASGDPIPTCTEFDSLGNTVFEAFFDNPDVESYRAVKFPYPPMPKYEAYIEEAGLGNIYEFLQGDTLDIGITVELNDLVSVGYNELIVTTYDYAPRFPDFETRAPMVLPQRIVLSEYSINFIGGEISFDAEMFNLPNPENITVYVRPTEGEGTFLPLTTSWNPVKGELTAEFDGFGEYIFTYPDVEPIVMKPQPQSPEAGTPVNFGLPLILEWSQDGFFTNFSLQVATDADFNKIVLDETGIMATIYEMDELDVNTDYFWRVKMSNDAGESDWSEPGWFTTAAPYLELIAPNGNEVLSRGLDYFIEWKTNFAENVILDLYKDGEMIMNIDTVENIDAYRWSLPADLDSACNYHISIRALHNSMIQDVSDTTFSINATECLGDEVASLSMISPNGGEVISKEEPVTLVWENNTGETVAIDLYKDGELVETLFTGLTDNTVSWSVATAIVNDDDYTLVVRSEGSMELEDACNGLFEITGSTGMDKFGVNFDLNLYPNPVINILNIDYRMETKKAVSIKLYSLDGRELHTIFQGTPQAVDMHHEFDMSGFESGAYIIRIEAGNQILSKPLYNLEK
ncbi:MAG: arylsulfotransferase family protein, partial [Bacteroidales bacterium]